MGDGTGTERSSTASPGSAWEADVLAISRIAAVPSILEVLCETTGLGFAAVARVTDDAWVTCAVLDKLGFGLRPGDPLDVHTTLCKEVRQERSAIVIDHVSRDERYCNHHTPKIYGFESYISVPIVRTDGSYFGNLCALDPSPAKLNDPKTVTMAELFAELIGKQLDAAERLGASESALLDARATAELREQFIAVLGHDIRNPLFAIRGGTELLLRRDLDRKAVEIVGHMQESCRRMEELVADVLDFARGRLGGGIPVERRRVDWVEQMFEQVLSECQTNAVDREIRLDADIRGHVFCDPTRIAQLFSNLLANAVTHGRADAPVQALVRSEGGALLVSVVNQGDPIPPEKLPQLFQPYTRGAGAAPQAGLGLGLYIASEIAKAHGGALTVVSTAEDGTRFTFTMPPADVGSPTA